METANLRRSIETVLFTLGIPHSVVTVQKLAAYSEELIRWNRRINLTGAKSAEVFVKGPLFDALTLLPVIPQNLQSFVDIGSGGGLPGIPAALVGSFGSVSLVEPRSKRASFLRHIVHFLSLEAEVIEAKDQGIARQWEGAVSQAVFEPKEWAMRAQSLVAVGGFIFVLTSERITDSSLPEGVVLDGVFECIRPFMHAPRFAYRLVRTELDAENDQSM